MFQPGRYLSGTIHLRSKVALWFEAGATLVGTTNLTEYRQPAVPDFMPEAKWGRWHRVVRTLFNISMANAWYGYIPSPEAHAHVTTVTRASVSSPPACSAPGVSGTVIRIRNGSHPRQFRRK